MDAQDLKSLQNTLLATLIENPEKIDKMSGQQIIIAICMLVDKILRLQECKCTGKAGG